MKDEGPSSEGLLRHTHGQGKFDVFKVSDVEDTSSIYGSSGVKSSPDMFDTETNI